MGGEGRGVPVQNRRGRAGGVSEQRGRGRIQRGDGAGAGGVCCGCRCVHLEVARLGSRTGPQNLDVEKSPRGAAAATIISTARATVCGRSPRR